MTYRDLVTQVLQELSAVAAGETPSADDASAVLTRLNRVINDWNAEREAIYSDSFISGTITPNLQPHTIGPTGTWTVAQRPVSIANAQLVIGTGTSAVSYDLTLRLAAWWNALDMPNLSNNIPTDLYYDATWPNGSVYLWPVPTAAYVVQMLVRGVLAEVTLDTAVSVPPGYLSALILTTAEECFTTFGTPADTRRDITKRATQARARMQANNTITPPLATRDVGLPGKRSWFNWRTGMVQ